MAVPVKGVIEKFEKHPLGGITMVVEYIKADGSKVTTPYTMSYERIMNLSQAERLEKCKREIEFQCDRYAEEYLEKKGIAYCDSVSSTEKDKWLATKEAKIDDVITNSLSQFIGETVEKNDMTLKVLETGQVINNQMLPQTYFGKVVKEVKVALNGNVTTEDMI